MFVSAFHSFIYEPLYNGLIYLVDVVPAHDVGIAVIILTIAVKIILYPLARQAIRTQAAMRAIAPGIEAIKARLKDKREEQARAIFDLYKARGIRPFSSFLLILLQFPILFGLYWVFWKGGLPSVDPALLYSFVPTPPEVNMDFLGIIHMGERSIFLAICTGLTQYLYTRLSMGPRVPAPAKTDGSFSSDMARSFELQARYLLPVIFAVIALTLAAALPLYWTASNVFMIIQELAMGRRFTSK
jgi:YidC/Oxa1 family membrane protein insertase